MLRLHQAGAQAGDRIDIEIYRRPVPSQELGRKLDQRQVQALRRRAIEGRLGQSGNLRGGIRPRRPQHDIQFRRQQAEFIGVRAEALVQGQCGFAARFQPAGSSTIASRIARSGSEAGW